MKLLALDTATEACSVALLAPERRSSRYEELGRGHSEHILAMVEAVLRDVRLELTELDAIAFGRGPGSFTGVRLAASVAQGLAFGAGVGVIPISNLRALAQGVLDRTSAASVLVCADARMSEVYAGGYRRGAGGLAQPCGLEEQVCAPDAVELPPELAHPVQGAGRGFQAYPQLSERLGGALAAVQDTVLPRADDIARLALAELAAGRVLDPEQAVPTYLRDQVARPMGR